MNDFGIKDEVIKEIVDIAKIHDVDKVILFGSRAKGTYQKTSDIDLAVKGGNVARFILDIEEETSTLLKYDIVNLDMPVQQELLDSIGGEGKVLYEKV